MKRKFILLAVLLLAVLALLAACGSTSSKPSKGLEFVSNGDGTCYVIDIGTCTDMDIVIPSKSPDGDSVTSIENGAFHDCSGLTSVTIPNSVTSIGDEAFEGCSGLTSVTIPNSVESIGERAFCECGGLTSVTIPNSVESIGVSAFSGCYKLIEVRNLSDLTITAGSFSNGGVGYYAKHIYQDGESYLHTLDDGYVFYENRNKVYLIAYNGNQPELILPANYNGKNYAINQYAFYNCSGLTSITIPNSVESIGVSAFYNCSGLTSVTIGNSVTSIGDWTFSRCSGLTSITIPNSVTSIGVGAFEGCSGLTSVTIGNSVTSIGEVAFSGCSGLTSVTIGNSVTSIGRYAFRGCSSLTSVIFANTSGWYRTETKNATSGTNMTVTNASANAANLKTDYYNIDYYWYRK